MIAKVLIFVCAAFGLASASCYEIRVPQECSSQQVISVPVQTEPSFSVPAVSESVFAPAPSSVFSSGSQVVSAPVLSDSSFSCGSSVPVVAEQPAPVVQLGGSSLSDLFAPGCSACSGTSLAEYFSPRPSAGSLSDLLSSGSSVAVASGNGPEFQTVPVLQAPGVTYPAVEDPMVSLGAAAIPGPKIIAQRCICTKTVVKPQIIQRTITVPKIQRFLKRTITPVIENIVYKTTPIVQKSSSSGSGSYVVSGSSDAFSSGSVSSQPRYIASNGCSC